MQLPSIQTKLNSIKVIFLDILSKRKNLLRREVVGIFSGIVLLFVVVVVVIAKTSTSVINTTSLTTATQASTQQHIVRTSDGTLHSFIQVGTQSATCQGSGKSGLLWFDSTDSGNTWTCGAQLSSDTVNFMYASAVVDSSDNIYVVYSVATNNPGSAYNVYYQKLTKGAGSTWSAGSAQVIASGSATTSYAYAVATLQGTTRLWVAARYFDGTNYQVSAYYSSDLSATPTWTLSQTSLGTAGSSNTSYYPAIVRFGNYIGVIYNAQLPVASMRWRIRNDSDSLTTWSPENYISANVPTLPTFTAISDNNGNVYFAQNNGTSILFNYWNGTAWSGNATVTATAVSNAFVSLSTDGANVWVFYGDTNNLSANLSGSRKLVYKMGVLPFTTADFDANSTNAVPYQDVFDKYWSYVGTTYTDGTANAASIAPSDTQMLAASGSVVYFGKLQKFDSLSWALSTNGAGGAATWEYWNGSAWTALAFTVSANTNFQANGWGSFTDPPTWATTTINGEGTPYYYIRARATSTYTTSPVGMQIDAIPQINWMDFLPSPVSNSIFGIWTENASSPIKVRSGSVTVNATTPNVASTANISPNVVGYSSLNTATQPSNMQHLVKTSDGTFHAFVQAGTVSSCGGGSGSNNAMGLDWVNSTNGGNTWSCGGQLSSDTVNLMYASAVVDSSDNIYVVYSVAGAGASSSYNVYYRKLTKGSGSTWSVGSQQTALSSTSTIGYSYGVIGLDSASRLWIAARYFDGSNYQVSVYYSSDLSSSPTWTVSKSSLNIASNTANDNIPAIVAFAGNSIGVVYSSTTGNNQRWRFRNDSSDTASWSNEEVVSTENINSAAFTVVADGNNVYYASNAGGAIYFTYWNGTNWQPTTTVTAAAPAADVFVGLTVDGTNAWVFYADTTNLSANLSGSREIVYKKGVAPFNVGNFDVNATPLISQESVFSKVWLYNGSTYQDLTTAASNNTVNDVFHSVSGAMVKNVGDVAYFGQPTQFDSASWALTTNGVGGQIAWEYWNGSSWVQLTKFLGISNSTFIGNGYLTFIPPSDWTANKVSTDGSNYYYIRARVIVAYSTAPIGLQLDAVPLVSWGSFLPNPVSNTIYGIWSENASSPSRIRFNSLAVTPEASSGLNTANISPGVVGYSSTTLSTQFSTMHDFVRTSDGTLHAFVQASTIPACGPSLSANNTNGLVWVYSTDSGNTWNCGSQLSADTTNVEYASAVVDSSDNIYLVYSVTSNGSNVAYSTYYRKLTKGSGSTWAVGTQQTALDATSGIIAYTYSVIQIEGSSRLWIATRYFDGANYQVAVYYSSDLSSSPSWNVSQTSLDTPTTSTTNHFPEIVQFGSQIGVLYNAQLPMAQLRWRFRNNNDALTSWATESVVGTENLSSPVYSAIGDSNGNVYHVSNSGANVFFSYWNGRVWSNEATVSATAANTAFVGLSTDGYNVWVFYGETLNITGNLPGSRMLVYKKAVPPYSASEFDSVATNVIPQENVYDKVWLYNGTTYQDLTTAASNVAVNDVFHSVSGGMVKNVGDVSYFGKTSKFDTASWALTTNGIGGIVTWEYWNGTSWAGLSDFQGYSAPSFTANGYITFTPPSDWASTKVNSDGSNYFYIRARTTTAYSTAPIGYQASSIPLINWANFLPAPVSNSIFGIWTENGNTPTRIRSGSVTVSTSTPNNAAASNLSPSTVSSTWYSSTANANQTSTMRHLVQTPDGTLHEFIQAGINSPCGGSTNTGNQPGLDWIYSTDTGVTWTCGGQLSNDTTNLAYASATIDSSGNIYAVYSLAVNGGNALYNVYYRKLTKGSGSTWTIGAQQTALSGSASTGYSYASVEVDGQNRLWLAARYFDGTNYEVSVYYSSDLSVSPTWTISQASLDTPGNNNTYHFPSVVRFGGDIGIIYNAQSTANMRWRYRADSDAVTSWNTEATVSSSNLTTPTFSITGDSTGNIYVAMNVTTSVIFTRWNGSVWSANATVSSTAANNAFVTVTLVGTNVFVYYGDTTNLAATLPGSRKLVYKEGVIPYATGNFDVNPTSPISYYGTFDKYWSYVGSTYTNGTTAASNNNAADTQMVSGIGDIDYFGKTAKFDTVEWSLSTNGVGGQIIWEYWNGSAWVPINKFLGVVTPSMTGSGYISFVPPTNWASTTVNSEGTSYYYVRARVITAFTTTPIGTQATSIPVINWASTVGSAANLYYSWSEGTTGPIRVRYASLIYNVAPYGPSSLGPTSVVNGSVSNKNNPSLTFTLNDPNYGDTEQYRIQISTHPDFSSPAVDYTSVLLPQGSASFTVGQAISGGSYTIGSAGQTLPDGSYYWRVMETDNGGLTSSYTVANADSIAFTIDTTPPTTNPSTVTMLRVAGGNAMNSNDWTNNPNPYFSWNAGLDNAGGSGVGGYCIYLGSDPSGNPATSKGLLGTSPITIPGATCPFIISTTSIDLSTPSFIGSSWINGSPNPYYLSIKVIDTVGNVYTGTSTQFQFRYDTTPPANVSFISTASGSFGNVADMNFAWPVTGKSASSDDNSGILGWQYQINTTNGIWQGSTTNTELGINYIPYGNAIYALTNAQDGLAVVKGNNTIYFRTVDQAGNFSSDATIRSGVLQFGGNAPAFANGSKVTVTPSSAVTNAFAVSWPTATAESGQSVTHYYYMINTAPPTTLATLQGNPGTYIDNGTSLSIDTGDLPNVNKGTNTVYVVAVDDSSPPNYSPSNYISGDFTLNSENPNPVQNLVISDSSIKSQAQWNVALTWTAPTYQGAGNLTYLVYRSTDAKTYSYVGSTNSIFFVDNTPASKLYYYYIITQDGANAKSAPTDALSITPTGRYTTPANLESGPAVSNITTKQATISWATDRNSDSIVEYGLSQGSYFPTQLSVVMQVTNHTVTITDLTPGTTYYYKVLWTDEDGNTASSPEYIFTTAPPPSVQDVTASNTTTSSTILTFTTIGANSVNIYYGTSNSFGSMTTLSTASIQSSYTTQLTGLVDGTKYYYKIDPLDADGNEYIGTVLTFTTLPNPKVTNIKIQQVVNTALTTVVISWNSNTAVSTVVSYYPHGQSGQVQQATDPNFVNGAHQLVVDDLQPTTLYDFIIKGRDKIGDQTTSDIQTFTTATDTRPPYLLDLGVQGSIPTTQSTSQTVTAQLVVTWNTDKPSTSQVDYSEGSGSTYNSKTQEDFTLTMNHLVVISGLTPSKVYHLEAISVDKFGNVGTSADTITITPKATNNALDLVLQNLRSVFGLGQ